MFDNLNFDHHHSVTCISDPDTGLKAVIAIHDIKRGPSLGGCRFWPYENCQDAITDALRLSRSMTYKNALADLPLGGGKSVIIGNPEKLKSDKLWHAYGRAIENLNGTYVTAEDVNTNSDDMAVIAKTTSYVCGLENLGGDPSPKTALGVYEALKAAIRVKYKTDSLQGMRIAIQGLGQVGWSLCERLFKDGANLVVTDIHQGRVEKAEQLFNASSALPSHIMETDCDVLVPCALGAVINEKNLSRIKSSIICGAANNQLATAEDGIRLFENDILYVPDYVANAGGVINVGYAYLAAQNIIPWNESDVTSHILQIGPRTEALLLCSIKDNLPPSKVADKMAQKVLHSSKAAPIH